MDDNSKFLAEQLANGLQETKKIVQNLEKEVHASAIAAAGTNATISTDIKSIKTTVESLEKIIRDPNTNSLINRISYLENKYEAVNKWIDEQKEVDKGFKTEDRRGKWQIKAAMFSGSVSLLIALGTIIFNIIAK